MALEAMDKILRSCNITGGGNFHFPVDFWMAITTVQCYCTACDNQYCLRCHGVKLSRLDTTYTRKFFFSQPVFNVWNRLPVAIVNAEIVNGFKKVCDRKNAAATAQCSYILELRRLQAYLLWCYMIVFRMVDLNFNEFFEWSPQRGTRANKYKLYRKFLGTRIRSESEFFSERIKIVWIELSISR